MKNEANKIIRLMLSKELVNFNEFTKNYEVDTSNNDCIEYLQSKMVEEKEIVGQDTYVFSDGSYITRLEDEYFVGNDVAQFEIEEEL